MDMKFKKIKSRQDALYNLKLAGFKSLFFISTSYIFTGFVQDIGYNIQTNRLKNASKEHSKISEVSYKNNYKVPFEDKKNNKIAFAQVNRAYLKEHNLENVLFPASREI